MGATGGEATSLVGLCASLARPLPGGARGELRGGGGDDALGVWV